MKVFLALLVVFISSVSFADVAMLKGKDALNLCSSIRELYVLQNTGLVQFPLAQVVRVKVENPQLFSLVIGNEDEYIACSTPDIKGSFTGTTQDTVKIVYNPEISLVETDRVLSGWSYAKAYNVSGALAENICAQLEMFNVAEDQAQIPAGSQVLMTLATEATNIFGLKETVISEKAFSCGVIKDNEVFQIPSVEGW